MMDGITWGAVLSDIGPATLVTIVVLLILAGKLRADGQVRDIIDVHKQRVDDARAEADTWRKAFEASEAARATLQESLDDLLELARVTEAILRSLEEGDPQ